MGYNLNNQLYASTVRIIACSDPSGFKMTAIRAARAARPFTSIRSEENKLLTDSIETLDEDAYITNLGTTGRSESRAIIIDDAAMDALAIGIDDVVDGFMQTVFSIHAIEDMCKRFTTKDGELNLELLKELNPDPQLLAELIEHSHTT